VIKYTLIHSTINKISINNSQPYVFKVILLVDKMEIMINIDG